MKAITQTAYGPGAALLLADVEQPALGHDEVLIRARAASVNVADWRAMLGLPYVMRGLGGRFGFGLRGPTDRVRGRDVAGVVEAVGSAVDTLRPGDEVYGEITGTFAEYTKAKASELAPKPASLSFEEAAAVPLAGVTALQGLRDAGKVARGQSVLINGASGGVGTFAVQIAKTLGAEVTAVCSGRNAELVRSIGADHVVDYTREDFADGQARYDVLLDLVGNRSLADCRRALKPRGMLLLSYGGRNRWVGPMGRILLVTILSPFVGQSLRAFEAKPNREDLQVLAQVIDDGKIKPVIDRTYRLSQAGEAIGYVEQGHARGKVVITV